MPCQLDCVREINEWARARAPNEINVEIAAFLGSFCPKLCTTIDSPSSSKITTSQTIIWSGFTSVENRQMAIPYVCRQERDRTGDVIYGVCGVTSDVYTIQRIWNPCL